MFTFKGRDIEKIAVVGSGQIGPDIALHFAKVFAPYEVPIVVLDVSDEALEKGRAKVLKKIEKGVETKAFHPKAAEAMKTSFQFTSNDGDVVGASLVVEAATETAAIKQKIFESMEALTSHTSILTSNSSHMEPEVIFENIKHPSRTLVTHYFFPAERNPMVEIVPGAATAAENTAWLMDLYEWMGKVPIQVKSRYGYAIDPVFEGIFQAAALCVEGGLGTTKEVDTVARETLGLGVGPFTAMNLTGGNPITVHGLDEMTEKIMPYFRSPEILQEAVEKNQKWDVPSRGEVVDVGERARDRISEEIKGAYFGIVCEVLDSGISNIADLDMGIELALVINAPFRMMNKVGIRDTLALVESYADRHGGFRVARALKRQAEKNEPWDIPVIIRRDIDNVAVLTIRRPKVLNAMNGDAFEQLRSRLEEIRDDAAIDAVVITGHGKKSFVSGADVGFLAKIDSREAGEKASLGSQSVINYVEGFPKPVVAAINGFAFGGGCEIAMGCHARVAKSGLKVLVAQPEPNLGIIPGAGGTQRMPRIIGIERASELLRTGRPISSDEAMELGLVNHLAGEDVVGEAIEFAAAIASDRKSVPPIVKTPMEPVQSLPDVDIGHLSKAVDVLIVRAIVEGAGLTLEDGLKLEAKLFGEVSATEDMKIGVRNFIEKGPRSKAPFVHR